MTARILFSLSALAAQLLAQAASPNLSAPNDVSPRFLRARLLCLGPAFVHAVAEQAALELPFAHAPHASVARADFQRSFWLMASTAAIDTYERRHLRLFLRC